MPCPYSILTKAVSIQLSAVSFQLAEFRALNVSGSPPAGIVHVVLITDQLLGQLSDSAKRGVAT